MRWQGSLVRRMDEALSTLYTRVLTGVWGGVAGVAGARSAARGGGAVHVKH